MSTVERIIGSVHCSEATISRDLRTKNLERVLRLTSPRLTSQNGLQYTPSIKLEQIQSVHLTRRGSRSTSGRTSLPRVLLAPLQALVHRINNRNDLTEPTRTLRRENSLKAPHLEPPRISDPRPFSSPTTPLAHHATPPIPRFPPAPLLSYSLHPGPIRAIHAPLPPHFDPLLPPSRSIPRNLDRLRSNHNLYQPLYLFSPRLRSRSE